MNLDRVPGLYGTKAAGDLFGRFSDIPSGVVATANTSPHGLLLGRYFDVKLK